MKKKPSLPALLLIFSLLAPAFGQTPQPSTSAQTSQTPSPIAATQQPSPTPEPQDDADEDVVKITSNLVQFDAVVTDKKGQPVTDLQPEDFEVFVGGKRQEVTNFSYISTEPGAAPQPQPARRPADKSAPPIPPARLKPGQVRRTIALVVDDLGTSFESVNSVRQALKKFVDEQMQSGDLVAIMRTSAGMGALQQFTSDKNILYRAIERVRWYPSGRSGVSAFAPLEGAPVGKPLEIGGSEKGGAGDNDISVELEEFREQVFAVGTLGTLSFIVRGMSELPGRKSIVMFSDGFPIINRRDPSASGRVLDNLRRTIDLANRASVVVYTVDARGLPYLGLNAADNTTGLLAQDVREKMSQRSSQYFDSQAGLQSLAEGTGGFSMRNTNDLGGAVKRVLDDQRGYYLIGFRPDESVFEVVKGRRHFNKLEVKMKRAGLRTRYRSGFIGITDEEAKPVRRTRVEQMVGALSSPFTSGDVRLRLTSVFGGDAVSGAIVSSLMHIDMSNIKFTDEADGWHKAVIDVIALTFGEEGQVVDQINRTETVRARAEAFDIIRRDGIIYTMRVPVKKPGAYQLRVAVRDASTEKLGAASQFIEVPNLKKDRLALSGIIMQDAKYSSSPAVSEGKQAEPDPSGNPAVRRFHVGDSVDYFFNIYNARTEGAGRPQLQTQMRLFRDGQQVYAGRETPFNPDKQTDMKNLQSGTRFRINSGLTPGEYVLQVVVTDTLAPEKARTATQWVDFEVVK
jgi:VWFA-related protein